MMGYHMGVAKTIKSSPKKQLTELGAWQKLGKLSSVDRERLFIAVTMGASIAAFWVLAKLFFGLPSYNYFIAGAFGAGVGGFFYVGTGGMYELDED